MNQNYDSNVVHSNKDNTGFKKDLMCGTLTKMKYLFWEFDCKEERRYYFT